MSYTRLAENQKNEAYAPQGVLSSRAAKRCLAVAGVTVAAMIPFTESTSEAQAQSTNTYTCPGAKVAFKDQSQQQFDVAVECVLNAERAERGLHASPNHTALGLAALRHSQDMAKRHYFSHEEPEPSQYGRTWSSRVQIAAKEKNADITRSPRAFIDGGEVIYSSMNSALPKNVIEWYLKSGGHCDTIMRNTLLYQGSGTLEGSNNVINNTIDLVAVQNEAPLSLPRQLCSLDNMGLIANIQDPNEIKKPKNAPSYNIDIKNRKLSKARLQLSIDVDDMANKNDPILNAKIQLNIRRWYGSKRRPNLSRTLKLDQDGKVITTLPIPSKSPWAAEVINQIYGKKSTRGIYYVESGKNAWKLVKKTEAKTSKKKK